jgi:hypothetical protein
VFQSFTSKLAPVHRSFQFLCLVTRDPQILLLIARSRLETLERAQICADGSVGAVHYWYLGTDPSPNSVIMMGSKRSTVTVTNRAAKR